jgi:prepilin-type N-terminal cleavage/methylation domain-containing protein
MRACIVHSPSVGSRNGSSRVTGFTLLEILLSVMILSVVATVTFMTFSAATTAWQRGSKLTDNLHHGDYVMHQLVMGLRSTYYPERIDGAYGFLHEDDGDGETARDVISWVKVGGALIGRNSQISETPHRVEFFLDTDEDGDDVVAVRSWRLYGQDEDFDPESIDPVFLSRRVVGFNCRMAWEFDDEGDIDWLDEWEETNRVPTVVEISLYVEPTVPGEDPVEMKRVIGLRVGALAWQ